MLIFSAILDILKGFSTAYYGHGNQILNKTRIAKYYLRNGFISDLTVLISLLII